MDLHKKKVREVEITTSSTRLLNSVFNKKRYEQRKNRMIVRDSKMMQKKRVTEEIERTRIFEMTK